MISFFDWFPPTLVGVLFVALGSLKLFGLYKGVVGGRDKPLAVKLCGT
jgi:hypothetical protein